ncbi:AcrR family transcriptional regulator [Variovorax boronicumulans]|uniref:AcrR family transcriptional regulator n=1 Tax=Variovorax boronicumulans TaxID=436515 RepID=A0A250DQH8_9BURK|nr:TetR-like C-terminal domain-containing protein [Variovorax boronicumulans]ATA56598.1 TetR family transcriptional regulator [Variovorax boronicumulans]MDP9879284.1 AcrR family transcriptional regulator [Variovorax boronicumulans]MDP9920008.1 AcrR family transcriptional regulator [Variovorax boronicumulans]MDP9925039.1 AcrR family transcriptional regulator [Variovorax boronicumulans]
MKLNNVPESLPPARTTYRHGDLRRALLDAGIELARDGGPSAVVLREATRRVGVVPNAAYRHFASRHDLLLAVRAAALSEAAKAMESELAVLPCDQPPADFARAQVRAIGTAYLRFAQAQPGLFRTAFVVSEDAQGDVGPDGAGASGMNPFELLGAAVDRLVDAGLLDPARRPGAEYLAWSAVHGLALLIIDGPLRGVDATATHALGQRLIDMVERGL